MKPLSASWWARAAVAAELFTEDEVKAQLRSRLAHTPTGKEGLARSLGVTAFQLTLLLRGHGRVTDRVAGALGYRKVIRFERVGEDEGRGAAFLTSE